MTVLEVEPKRRAGWFAGSRVSLTVAVLALAVSATLLAMPDRILVGVGVASMMLSLILVRVPVGIALGIPGVIGMFAVGGVPATVRILSELPFQSTASWSLSVLPMFILMGYVLWKAGITDSIYLAARSLLSWLPGGLAFTTNLAGAGLSTSSGSTLGITYAVGRVGLYEMRRVGYSKPLAAGAVTMAGASGQLIPPSIQLVVFAGVAGVAVGPQLMAGLLPGILLAALIGLLIIGYAILKPEWAPPSPDRPNRRETVIALVQSWPIPVIAVVVIGGMYSGLFTATEAGAVGAATAIVAAAVRARTMSTFITAMRDSLFGTASTVGSIFLLLIGTDLLSRALSATGITQALSRWLTDMQVDYWLFAIILVVFFFLLGTFMEPIPLIVLTVPILLDVVTSYGLSPFWFGVFVIIMGEVAILSPPVGILTFVVQRISADPEIAKFGEIKLSDIFKGVALFAPAVVIVLLLLFLFPSAIDWLPSLIRG